MRDKQIIRHEKQTKNVTRSERGFDAVSGSNKDILLTTKIEDSNNQKYPYRHYLRKNTQV